MSFRAVLQEAQFYCVDLSRALYPIRDGLYVSSGTEKSWIVMIEYDANNPGVTRISFPSKNISLFLAE